MKGVIFKHFESFAAETFRADISEKKRMGLELRHVGDINQVVLDLVVNAAHAIEARVAGSDARGKIKVVTRRAGNSITISVSDDGSGIPTAVVDRIFDPFFTTKAEGEGTTFHIRIPVTHEGGTSNVAA